VDDISVMSISSPARMDTDTPDPPEQIDPIRENRSGEQNSVSNAGEY
jgi:hypothetical protein